ncbi:MAG TPA: hypothetical protein DCZ92_03685 [Elusimicrobia bacterium]|nr:MAG: hypothetical protein A2016_01420 [Elusimicrobia bacterium GWF2_62_30]HBA59920.1 hypothetical protein [Elusimicrobiota bacterium]
MIVTASVYLFGGLAALATLLMLFQRNPVKAAMLMLTALLATAGLYLALSAQLLAVLQIILYAGAIMTLFIVALTVTPQALHDKPSAGHLKKVLGLAAAALILVELVKVSAALRGSPFSTAFSDAGTLDLARQLFGRFAYQFELLSLVILASIVAAVTLAAARKVER